MKRKQRRNNNDDPEAEKIKKYVEGKNEGKEMKKGMKGDRRRGKDEQ
jgi:hypothetical protein